MTAPARLAVRDARGTSALARALLLTLLTLTALVAPVVAPLLAPLHAPIAAPAASAVTPSAPDEPAAPAPDDPVALHVRALSLVVGPAVADDAVRVRLLVEHRGTAPFDDVALIVAVHPATRTRAALTEALTDGPATSSLRTRRVAVGRLVPGDLVVVEATLSLAGLGLARAAPDAAGSAVLPLVLTVVDAGRPLHTVTSAVAWLTGDLTDPVAASLVVPWADAPWRGPGDAYPRGVSEPVRDGGRLDAILRGLEERPTARVVVAPATHLVEDLADRADGFLLREDDGTLLRVEGDQEAALASAAVLDRVRRLVAALPTAPLAGPYADADLAALARSGDAVVRAVGAEAALEGPRRLLGVLGREVDDTTVVGAPLDPAVLDLVVGSSVLVPSAAVAPDDARRAADGRALRRLTTPSGGALDALVADPDATALLTAREPDGGPLHAAHLVAMLAAATAFEDPATGGRTMLVLAPRDWAPSPELVAGLVARLEDAPWVALDAPSRVVAAPEAAREPLILPVHADGGLPPELTDGIRAALGELQALQLALPASSVPLEDGSERSVASMRVELVRATSAWWAGSRPEARALVDDVIAATRLGFGAVDLGVSEVTLTARDGVVPVTLTRTAGPPIDVVVELVGPAGLEWPDGPRTAPLRLDPGVETTVALATRSRATGDLPVVVRVTDPSGVRPIATGRLTVRATAASRPALVGIGAVVLGLLVAGGRRRRRRALADAGDASA